MTNGHNRRRRGARRNLERIGRRPSARQVDALAALYTPLEKELDDIRARAVGGKLTPQDRARLRRYVKADLVDMRAARAVEIEICRTMRNGINADRQSCTNGTCPVYQTTRDRCPIWQMTHPTRSGE